MMVMPTLWTCPNCRTEARLPMPRPGQTHLHTCPRLRGLTAPLVPMGMSVKVEAKEREDYVGRELVQTDEDGRPVMAVVTTRDNGQDAIVFAPTATGDAHG
jgi:hypothetical protein